MATDENWATRRWNHSGWGRSCSRTACLTTFRPVALTANGGTLAAVTGEADFEGNITGTGPLAIGDPVNTGLFNSAEPIPIPVHDCGERSHAAGAFLGSFKLRLRFYCQRNSRSERFSSEIGSLAGTGTVTNGVPLSPAVLTTGADNMIRSLAGS